MRQTIVTCRGLGIMSFEVAIGERVQSEWSRVRKVERWEGREGKKKPSWGRQENWTHLSMTSDRVTISNVLLQGEWIRPEKEPSIYGKITRADPTVNPDGKSLHHIVWFLLTVHYGLWLIWARTGLGKQSMYVAGMYSYIVFHLSFNLVIPFPLPQGRDDSAESK